MRFNIAATVALALATTAAAAPNPCAASSALAPRGETSVAVMKDALAYAAAASGCNFFDCLGILADVGCITAAIVADDWGLLAACQVGGSQAICGCLDCIPGLSALAQQFDACPST